MNTLLPAFDPCKQRSAAHAAEARQVLAMLGLPALWEQAGTRCTVVGSLATGLLAAHLDIDLHVYTPDLTLAGSVALMAPVLGHAAVRRMTCRNSIATDEACVEWHLWCTGPSGREWQLDIIHLRAGSAYDGFAEDFGRRLLAVLTPERRQAILHIKFHLPRHENIPALRVYEAVIAHGIRTWPAFRRWLDDQTEQTGGINRWRP